MESLKKNFAGLYYGHLFGHSPDHIDKSKPPGFSELPVPTAWSWVQDALLLRHIWASPNLPWCIIALLLYFIFPFDLSSNSVAAQGPLTWAFFSERFPIWIIVVFGYDAFWHVTLYFLNWAKRPFIPNREYRWSRTIHNVFYSFAGVVIWVGFENVFAFLWSTGRLAYLSDHDAFHTQAGMIRFFLGLVLMPLWRDSHFYFAHRLLHYKPMYSQVHSLHHRNTDIEPFAGLSMHPIEHLYYYSCILPNVFMFASPFHLVWNGIHLLLAPGASHSGWEDHFQADAFHYMHHRYFECNYAGFNASALDNLFGSFMARFKEDPPAKARPDPKSTLVGLPTGEFVLYLLLSCSCVALWAITVNQPSVSSEYALFVSLVAGFGPVIVACIFSIVTQGVHTLIEPFKIPVWGHLLHIIAGFLFCSVPITATCLLSF